MIELQALVGNRAVAEALSKSGPPLMLQRIEDFNTWIQRQNPPNPTYALLQQYMVQEVRPAWAASRARLNPDELRQFKFVDTSYNEAARQLKEVSKDPAPDFAAFVTDTLTVLVEVVEAAVDQITGNETREATERAERMRLEAEQARAQQPQPRFADSTEGGTMDKLPNDNAPIVDILINKFDISSVSPAEASKPRDCVVTHEIRTKRIDRQGPAFDGTHAKFAVQIGTATYAGIHMPVNIDFPIDVVRGAFRASLVTGKYQKLSFS